ncbi:hypothetical protein E2C01_006964 [Portunus trituberculatus]|uniref:Uncharacterized protein n=1 Tax=Portunus trituberculatus TaxID=210409 RepID=A0A5B7CYR1_PORTR|nr:hypothetical protein [Portunus trituberculatus]
MADFSGAGGMTRPEWRCFSTNLRWRPKKSLNRLMTLQCFFLWLERATATGVTGVGAAGVMFGVRLGVAVGVMGTTGGVRGAPMGGRMLEGGTGGSDVS